MANKKPLAHYSGVIKELQSGDAVAGADLEAIYFNNWNDAYQIAIDISSIVSGTATLSSGLTLDIIPTNAATLVWYINATRYTHAATQVTLATSDPTNARIDVIYFDNTGNVGVVTGTPAPSPIKPVVDSDSQVELTFVTVPAGATSLTGSLTVYDENTEFTGASTNGTANFANTTAPAHGTKHISIGSFTSNQNITLTDGVTHDASTIQYLKYRNRLLATFTNNTYLSFYFANNTTPVSNQVNVTNGQFGFNRTVVGSYQTIVVPISLFTFSSPTFNRIYIIFHGSNASGFYLDFIELQGGVTTTPPTGVTSFNSRTGNVLPATGDYSYSQVTGAAPLASPAFTGNPTAPTQTQGDNSTKLSTTAYVDAAKPNSAKVYSYFNLF